MNAPLYNQLIKYSKEITSFHMPGHKSSNILNIKDIPFLDLDVTEVPGLDNLYEAEGIILQAEEEMAKRYGSKETIFITNGSTAGIIASILSVCSPGDTLVIARNCHHSVWNALILGGIKPIYINPSHDEKHNMLGGICPDELEQILKDNPKSKGVIIVSPTYEGLVSDIESIAKVVHQYNKLLIVDEAHGAHFVWHDTFPKSAVSYGADLVIQSMHKTLPTLTQSALVHLGGHRIQKETLIRRLQMTQTSSPSYVMMGIMDYARALMETQPELWTKYSHYLLKTRSTLENMENLVLLSKDSCKKANLYDLDESKLTIFTYNADITGVELGKLLRREYNIQVEVEADDYIIAMSTIADGPEDLELLANALLEIDAKLKKHNYKIKFNNKLNIDNEENRLPRAVYFGEKEEVLIEDSIGRVSGINIMLYPPGIPLICIGEVFSKQTISNIKRLSTQVLGVTIIDHKLKVLVAKEGEEHEG